MHEDGLRYQTAKTFRRNLQRDGYCSDQEQHASRGGERHQQKQQSIALMLRVGSGGTRQINWRCVAVVWIAVCG